MADIILTPEIPAPTYANGILDYALNVAPLGTTVVSPRNMGITDLPNSGFMYGTAIIVKRNSVSISVTIFNDSSQFPPISNTYNSNTSAWNGWRYCSGMYCSSKAIFDDVLQSSVLNSPFLFEWGSTTTNSISAELGSNYSCGYVFVTSSILARGILTCNGKTYYFSYNPDTKALLSLKKLTDELSIISPGSVTSCSFNIPNSYRGVLFGMTTGGIGTVITVAATSGGVVTYMDVKTHENITWSTATNKLTATFSTAYSLRFAFLNLNGEASLITS